MKRTAREYAAALHASVAAGVDPETAVRRLRTLLRRSRATRLLPRILRNAEQQLNERRSIQSVVVATAYPQSRSEITALLERRIGKNEPRLVEQPELIGGAVIRSGDRQIDGSIARLLRRLRTRLTGSDESPLTPQQ